MRHPFGSVDTLTRGPFIKENPNEQSWLEEVMTALYADSSKNKVVMYDDYAQLSNSRLIIYCATWQVIHYISTYTEATPFLRSPSSILQIERICSDVVTHQYRWPKPFGEATT